MKVKSSGLITIVASFLFVASMLHAQDPTAEKAALERKQRNQCINNLKQIGLSIRLWGGDNGGNWPFNVPQKKGGTMELCSPGADGFDANGWRHFQVLSNELSTPKVLACPADSAKTAAATFAALGAANVSYQIRSGKDINSQHPAEVFAHCPIHNVDLMCDGAVMPHKAK
jgi:hypothetical protein